MIAISCEPLRKLKANPLSQNLSAKHLLQHMLVSTFVLNAKHHNGDTGIEKNVASGTLPDFGFLNGGLIAFYLQISQKIFVGRF